MKTCQLDTNFYFVAVNDRTLGQTLSALRTQRLVADFIVDHQGSSPAQIQREFLRFAEALRSAPPPQPAELDTYNMESIVGA